MGAPRLTLPSSSTRGLGLDSKRLIAAVEAAVTYYRDQLAPPMVLTRTSSVAVSVFSLNGSGRGESGTPHLAGTR